MTLLTALVATAALLLPADDESTDALELSLPDAIAEAFSNNPSLKGALLDSEASLQGFNAAWGDFDTTFFVNSSRSRNIAPPTSTTVVNGIVTPGRGKSQSDNFSLSSGFRGALQTGTSWELAVNSRKDANVQSQTFGPDGRSTRYTANWNAELTHPLLKDGAGDFAVSGIQLAAKDVQISSLAAEITANDTITTVIESYWNLVFARQDAETRELSVQLAAELLDITNRKFEQGLQNRIDVIEVEAELARRREERLTAVNALEQAIDDLRKLVFSPGARDDWGGSIVPVTDYSEIPQEVPTLDEAVDAALGSRPDVLRARAQVERAELEVERAENATLPTLDVTGSYGHNAEKSEYRDTIRDLNDERNYSGSLSVAFELPLGNRQAGYTLRRRQIDHERAVVSKSETELNAIGEVRQAARDVALQKERVEATAETTRLRREVYEGEKRRLENDLSTPFQVREAQRDLLEAIDSELRARLDLAVAHTSYRAAQGTLLERFGYTRFEPDVSLEAEPPSWDE
jgi:outer membrane protein TolC